jgi:ligand-binding SRPBCC domain-containing protein
MIHTLERTMLLKGEPGRVWEYFSNPKNLDALTPPEMDFEILGEPGPLYAGQLIAYRIRIAPGIRIRWLTEIRHVAAGTYFADEQRIGPYKLWYHEHHFAARDGGVEMRDRVTYALPFGLFGEWAHALWVKRQLVEIFDYRGRRVMEAFA